MGAEAQSKLVEYRQFLTKDVSDWDGDDSSDLLPALKQQWTSLDSLDGTSFAIDGPGGAFDYANGAEGSVTKLKDKIETPSPDGDWNQLSDATASSDKKLWMARKNRLTDANFLNRLNVDDDSAPTTMGMNSATRRDLDGVFYACRREKCSTGELDRRLQLISPSGSGSTSERRLGEFNHFQVSLEDTSRVMASFTGREGPLGFGPKDSASEEGTILLSFSGGGPSTEFIFSSNENIASEAFSWTLGMQASASNAFGLAVGITVAKTHYKHSASMSRDVSKTRAVAWAKYERMSTVYSLGDPEFGDKFVVQVSSDVRFGTPVFITQGGRSKCPGERLTMFREAGFKITRDTTHNERLNPGEHAIIQLKIVNESPYKERANMGLRLVDGTADCVQRIVFAAMRAAELDADDANKVQSAVNSTADGHECLASESKDVKKLKSDVASLMDDYNAMATNAGMSLARTIAKLTQTSAPAGEALQGMKFAINGIHMWAFGEVLPLKRLAGDFLDTQSVVHESHLALSVEPADGLYESLHLGVSLVSLCESMIESYMDRPIISSTTSLGAMSWSMKCPKVAFHPSTLNKPDDYFVKSAKSDSTVLKLLAINPNRYSLWPDDQLSENAQLVMNEALRYVYLQYRPLTGGEWLTAKDEVEGDGTDKKFNLLCPDSRGDGCAFDWNLNDKYEKLLSGYKDGRYEIRLKTYCVGGSHLADEAVHSYVSDQTLVLTIDTKTPLIGALSYVNSQTTQRVDFMEPIDCTDQKVSVQRSDSSTGTFEKVTEEDLKNSAYPFVFQCMNAGNMGYWLLKFPSNARGYYKVSVGAVHDIAGNARDEFNFVAPVRVSGSTGSSTISTRLGFLPSRRSERMRTRKVRLDTTVDIASTLIFCFIALVAIVALASRARKYARVDVRDGSGYEKVHLNNAVDVQRYGAAV